MTTIRLSVILGFATFAVLTLAGCGSNHANEVMDTDSREQSSGAAQIMASMQKTGLDPNQQLRWCYYFTGHRDRLEQVSKEIERSGYDLRYYEPTDDGEFQGADFVLIAEKVEHHSAISLEHRIEKMSAIAMKNSAVYSGTGVARFPSK